MLRYGTLGSFQYKLLQRQSQIFIAWQQSGLADILQSFINCHHGNFKDIGYMGSFPDGSYS